jgi:hypothetical protein
VPGGAVARADLSTPRPTAPIGAVVALKTGAGFPLGYMRCRFVAATHPEQISRSHEVHRSSAFTSISHL